MYTHTHKQTEGGRYNRNKTTSKVQQLHHRRGELQTGSRMTIDRKK
ncbi:hypothetical protein LSH36_194g03033 [Paralvinella palmiformis]|uniref:Uncharacterized protein n=1 Tax=Paralvinella palmiformis TaxID=53620 RepID=A0AAD9JS95_9ANNE|nr:hypothetical protein LSH36_194g03033 [Paralvinella palmiformis]